jgi:RNA polymerase sigma-70 factor, ECF subfamily
MNDEQQLISAAESGDREAFHALYTRHVDSVYRLSLRMLGDPLDSEEVTQDVFVRVFRSLASFDARSSFKTWCLQIAINASYDVLRKRKRRAPHQADWRDDIEVASEHDERTQLMKVDLQYHLVRALNTLHEDLRTTFILRDIEDLAYQEISDLLGCSLGTVASRLARARKQMAARLSQVGIDAEYLGTV